MIVIADCGLGNISSVRNMLQKAGCTEVSISGDAHVIASARKLILPGVGAFDHGIRCLRQADRVAALNEAVVKRGVPILGICLGMQLMCRSSEEGELPGLGWVNATVRRFQQTSPPTLKVPHMGWNVLTVTKTNPLLAADAGEERFYFVHSFHAVCEDTSDVLATACHGYFFDAAFSRDNVFGVQFHPEKSHRFGMALMKRFAELPC